jgi:hypothetical protein
MWWVKPLPDDRFTKIASWLTLALLGLGGLAMLGFGLRNVWRAAASSRWPTTEGVIENSTSSASVSRDSRATSTTYSAYIVARYHAAGRDLVTNLVRFGQTAGSGDVTDAELERLRYPAGGKVTVSYHPGDPTIAVMRPGIHAEVFGLPGAGLAFLLPAIMFGFLMQNWENSSGLKTGMTLFVIIFALIGVTLLSLGVRNLWRGFASQRWPSVPGVVRYGKVEFTDSVTKDEDGNTEVTPVSGGRMVYQYEVNGRKHFNNVMRFGLLYASSDGSHSEDIARTYPAGSKVEVSYDPSDPDLATIVPGIDNEAYWLPAAGAAFFLFGLAVWVWGIPALTGPGS